MYRYPVSFEIAGNTALFTRPDSGSTPISYPVPTWSAAKGMFEAVARFHGAYIHPTHVEICNPIKTARYVTNYGGPLRKSGQIKDGNNLQLIATVLSDVRYRIHGVALVLPDVNHDSGERKTTNAAHALQDRFERRLKAGRLFYTPCLGWKEFTPSYFGALLPESQADESIELYIPSLLHSVFDSTASGKWQPQFRTGVRVERGVLYYDGRPGAGDENA